MDTSNDDRGRLPEDVSNIVENQEQIIPNVNQRNEKEMLPIPWYKYVPATFAVILLIWKPLFVVLFPGWVYTSDLSTVFLFQGCIGGSTQTVFVFCLLCLTLFARARRL